MQAPKSAYSIHRHRLEQADYWPSPYCDQRPPDSRINLLVVHSISLPEGQYGTDLVRQLFMGELREQGECGELVSLRVSAHLLIRRDASLLQFVPFTMRAWHAGQSNYQGHEDCNDFSIGIELEGTDTDVFTDCQYQALISLAGCLRVHYPGLSVDRIVGHSQIATPPGRKTDPGSGFDWQRLFDGLQQIHQTPHIQQTPPTNNTQDIA